MNIKKISIISISSFAVFFAICYFVFLFVLPPILNSHFMVKKYEKILCEKLGYSVKLEDFEYKSNPNISFNLKAGKILAYNVQTENLVLNTKDFGYFSKMFSIKPKKIDVNTIYLDCRNLKQQVEKKQN